MLILKRNLLENVIISVGDIEIKVTLIETQNSAARIGFEAPSHVTIDREEVYLAKKNNEPRRSI